MNNPYEVLGIPDNASDDQVREAYRSLARRIQEDINNGTAPPYAQQRMRDIDEAYDAIIMSRSTGYSGNTSSSRSDSGYYSAQSYVSSDFSDIREKIRSGRLDDAEVLLDGISNGARNAEWHFLKGTVQYRKGWLEEAGGNFAAACRMDPNNREYRAAYDNLSNSSSGGYRTTGGSGRSDLSPCKICTGLICADTCCECMGGDLIRCC